MAEVQSTVKSQPSVVGLRGRTLLRIVLTAGFVMLAAEALRVFVGSNFFAVVPGKCYRSAQPSPQSMENALRAYSIRSIVNLRDENDEGWYHEEKRTADRLGILLLNAGLSSKEQAPAEDFAKFVRVMRDAPEPILIHCANGNDRSGLAAAFYLLLRTDTPLEQARTQLSLRYGHIPWSKASCLRRVLDSYEGWLHANQWEHTAERLVHWGTVVYRPE